MLGTPLTTLSIFVFLKLFLICDLSVNESQFDDSCILPINEYIQQDLLWHISIFVSCLIDTRALAFIGPFMETNSAYDSPVG